MAPLAKLAEELPQEASFWLPPKHSSLADGHDGLFYFILWLSVFFFVLVVGLMVFFIIRYRRREGHEAQPSPEHNTALEVTWSLLPAALLVVVFVWGFDSYMYGREAPANAEPIRVIGRKWSWEFRYPNGVTSSELHVPVGRPVKLTMTSVDVIHSMYLPTLRLKRDTVPGRYSELWFDTNTPGVFPLRCAEYCGQQHSDMVTKFVVHPAKPGEVKVASGVQVKDGQELKQLEAGSLVELDTYEAWLESERSPVGTMPLADAGKILAERGGCMGCHSLDGSRSAGPSFKGVWQREVELHDGTKLVADENYIRESILKPNAKVVKSFGPPSIMSVFAGRFSEEELGAIIEWLKTIK
ncbi:MAG: cytochrome c oxidase subunit II [Planctomycetota bacterium]|nr:MAG: cytochrome c oxidase subunit II [Planctomycetota bacterium]